MSDTTLKGSGPRLGGPRAARRQGALLTTAGVLVLSADALLVGLIPAEALAIAFWRGLLMALGFWILYAARSRSLAPAALLAPSRPTLLAALLFAGSTLCFVVAVKLTAIANVLLIVATIPLSAALLSRLALGERVAPATWLAIAGALAGIACLLSGELGGGLGAEAAAGPGRGSLLGIALALAVTLFVGGYLTVLRSGRVGEVMPSLVLAGLISAAVAALLAPGLQIPEAGLPWLLLLGLVVMPVSFTLISLGPRHLPAAEVGLIMLLETVFGTLWAWLFLAQLPSTGALAGGAIIVLSLLARALATR